VIFEVFYLISTLFRKAGQRSLKLAERAREVSESAAYDFRDQLIQAYNDNEPLDPQDREMRNALVELYLGKFINSLLAFRFV
jgi:acyl-CoA hydrolase